MTPGSTPLSAIPVGDTSSAGTAPAGIAGRSLFGGKQAATTTASTGHQSKKQKRSRSERKKARRAKQIAQPLLNFKNTVNLAVANGRKDGLKTDEMDEAYEAVSRADDSSSDDESVPSYDDDGWYDDE